MMNDPCLLNTPTHFNTQDSFNKALTFCIEKLQKSRSEVINLLKEGNVSVHSDFRYDLAKRVANYLGFVSCNLLEVYIHGSAIKNSSRPGSDIDLIISLEEKVEPLNMLLARLNDEIEFHYNQLLETNRFNGDSSNFLDIKLVDKAEIEERKGFGAVVSSPYSAPIKIWQNGRNKKQVGSSPLET